MAPSERDRARSRDQFDLSDEEVATLWDAIVTNCRRPKLDRAMSAWKSLGEKYAALEYQVGT